MAINLKDSVRNTAKVAKETGKQATIGALSGYVGGSQRSEERGESPTKQMYSGAKRAAQVAKSRGSWGMQQAKAKIANEAKDAAGRASGLSDLRETKQNIDKFRKGNLRDKAAAIGNESKAVASRVIASAAFGQEELDPLIRKALDQLTSKKFYRNLVIFTLIPIGVILMLLFDSSSFDPPKQMTPGSNTPSSSDNCVPPTVNKGQESVCTITVTDTASAQDIVITDMPLAGEKFVSAGQGGKYDATTNTVTWDAAKLGLQLNPVNITVTVTLQVTTGQDNVAVHDAYTIIPTGLTGANGGGSGAIPGNVPPNTDNCSGVYAAYMAATPGHQNYGDPTCSLVEKDPNGNAIIDKDKILSELQTLKSSEAMGWFICVVPNESGYNANAYLGASTSGFGAYGLVQMNPTGHGNNKYDNGEVNWPLQLSNGINYNDSTGHTFAYWPTSYDSCLKNYGVTVN